MENSLENLSKDQLLALLQKETKRRVSTEEENTQLKNKELKVIPRVRMFQHSLSKSFRLGSKQWNQFGRRMVMFFLRIWRRAYCYSINEKYPCPSAKSC